MTKNRIPVTGLTKPLKLKFTVSPAPTGKQHGCNYYKEQTKTWVKIGLTAVDGGNNTLICESTHATFFAPSTDATNTTTAPPTTSAVGGKDELCLNACAYSEITLPLPLPPSPAPFKTKNYSITSVTKLYS